MKINLHKIIFSFFVTVGFFIPMATFATTGVIDSTSHTAKLCNNIASNADCHAYTTVNWKVTNWTGSPGYVAADDEVSVTDTGLTGFIFAENAGWIHLNPDSYPPTVAGCSASKVVMSPSNTGTLTGCGWGGDSGGWVNFAPSYAPSPVTISTTTGEFSGWAWVSGAGWMNFDCSGGAGSDGCVKTSWRPTTSGGGGHVIPPPPPVCLLPLVGVYPDCHLPVVEMCILPLVGTYPDCSLPIIESCVLPLVGTYPDCHLPVIESCVLPLIGTYPDCHLPLVETCTSPLIGTYPDCHLPVVERCIPPLVGTYPDCHFETCIGPTCAIDTTDGGGIGGGGGDTCIIENSGGVIGNVTSGVKNSLCETKQTIKKTKIEIKKIISTGTGNIITETIATVGVVAGGAASLASALFINPISFSELFLIPVRLWSLLMTALGLKKRRRPWGTVYDSVTKQPLDPAYVTLKDIEGKEIVSSITDLDGRFGFVVPAAGMYSLYAQKTNYVFPSQKLVGHDHDELYRDLYFGEHFKVAEAGEVVIRNIPMDPEKFDWNEFAKKEQNLMRFYSKRDKWLRRFSDIFFAGGFFVASVAVLAAPKTYNVIIFLLYVLLYFVRTFGIHSRPYGDIVDKTTGTPISFGIIRISNIATGVEVMHRIADAKGRYYALLPNGDYKVRIDKKLPDGTYQTVLTDAPATVTKGYLSQGFSI